MKRNARVDDNQPQIVEALKRINAVVIHTHQLKNAFDILVSFRGELHAVEIKDKAKFPKKFAKMDQEEKAIFLESQLTDGEKECKKLLELTGTQYKIVYDVDSALRAIGAFKPQ